MPALEKMRTNKSVETKLEDGEKFLWVVNEKWFWKRVIDGNLYEGNETGYESKIEAEETLDEHYVKTCQENDVEIDPTKLILKEKVILK